MKRICLFAGYNYANKISQYVEDYVKELSRYCDIYYLADGTLPDKELEKLTPFVKKAWVQNHRGYDFYSWHLLATQYVGWKEIEQYEELILANDSCFCVNPFGPVFEQMDMRQDLDMWGLLAADNENITEFSTFKQYLTQKKQTFFIGSYFLAFRSSFFKKKGFRRFIKNIQPNQTRALCFEKYEIGILQLALKEKAIVGCFNETVYRYSTTYMRDAFNLIKNQFPLLKVRIFVDNIGGQPLMRQLADAVAPFCQIDYRPYIRQIQQERSCKVCSWKEKKHDLYKKFTAWRKGIKRFFKRPPYGGIAPSHVKNYFSNQQALIQPLKDKKDFVIFFNVMRKLVAGGMLSINRFIQHSMPFARKNDFQLILSGIPLNNACTENPFFEHALAPIDFHMLIKAISPRKLMLNIPECFILDFFKELTDKEYVKLFSIPDLRINILNQNDELMPCQHFIEELRTLCNNRLTITAAHKKYATAEKEAQYKCPVYLLTPFLPEFYWTDFRQKEKLIVLSPDQNEFTASVIKKLRQELPDYRIKLVQHMKLEDYKRLISRACFALTFGEGYDGYFLEPYLSGSLSFSVRNPNFFPSDFKKVPTVYDNWETLLKNVVPDMKRYAADPSLYTNVCQEVTQEIRRFTNNHLSEENLQEYYDRFLDER